MSERKWERILANDIEAGMEVARARTHEPVRVSSVKMGPVAITIHTLGINRVWTGTEYVTRGVREHVFARPRRTAAWWRVIE